MRDPETGAQVRTGDIIPEAAVDRNAGSPALGDLHAVWQDSRFDHLAHDSIAFSKSADGGFTWSTAIQINQTPTSIPSDNQQAFTPSIAVASDGTIGVTYYDFRNNGLCRAVLQGDYEDLGMAGLKFRTFFATPHGSDPASVFFRQVGP